MQGHVILECYNLLMFVLIRFLDILKRMIIHISIEFYLVLIKLPLMKVPMVLNTL